MKRGLLTALFITCIDAAVAQPTHHEETVAIVRGVDLKAGVTSSEATAIAELYFHAYVSGCGGAAPPVDGSDHW